MAQNSSLARELEVDIPKRSPSIPDQTSIHMPAPRTAGITKFEKALLGAVAIIAFALISACITMQISIATTNRSLQDTTTKIADISKVNENLHQEVQELSRYDRVYSIAGATGLKMNENNVRNVSK